MKMSEKYSIPCWVKKTLEHVSIPENEIIDAVRVYTRDGEHPGIRFDGSTIELTNELYIEWRKRYGVDGGFFPTPYDIAKKVTGLLPVSPGDVVLDPGCGFGNLSLAVQERCGCEVVGVELQWYAAHIAEMVGVSTVVHGDFVGDAWSECDNGCSVPEFDAVITNPPYGKVFARNNIERDFLNRIADLAKPGTPVAVILPRDHMEKKRPKAHVAMCERFSIVDRQELCEGAFKPLTSIETSVYLLTVDDGRSLAFKESMSDVQIETEPRQVKQMAMQFN